MIEAHNTPLTPPPTSYSSVKALDFSPMSSYRYPPANPDIPGSWSQPQYPQPQYAIGNEQQYREQQYRAQQSVPPPSTTPLNLPPLRSIDPRQQQQQQNVYQHSPSTSAASTYGGAPIGHGYAHVQSQMSSVAPQAHYYPHQIAHHAGPYDPVNYPPNPAMMRYPLPMGDVGRNLPPGRHKKEVKRRTKTGCLTCRKRRIKCDEGHPTCRNCQKSKRECAGYDPIFKAQSSSSAAQPSAMSSQSSQATASPALAAPSYSTYSQGQSANTNSPRSSFDRPKRPSIVDPPAHGVPASTVSNTFDQGILKGSQSSISRLLVINGHEPQPTPPMRPISQQLHSNLYSLWTRTFAPALGHLLETAWFEGSTSTSILLGNHPHKNIELEWEFAHFVRMVSDTQQDDPTIPSREARLIWRFFRLAQYYTNTVNDAPSDAYEDAMLTSRRINVLQALLTGESLQSNPLNPSTIYGSSEMENYPVELQLKERESEFWYNLGNFTTRLAPTDQPNESAREASQESLTRMRYVLDAYENRDLLYSIAICRFFGELYRQAVPETQSDRASYFVAKGFIESEVTRGSSTVMKTVSRIAMRSWPEL